MSTDKQGKKTPPKKDRKQPANPVAERASAETAHPANSVEAKDVFGAPRPDTDWTREAMATKSGTPGFDGVDDKVKKERADDFKE